MSTLVIHRCADGHEVFYRHERCPQCGAPLVEVEVSSTATLTGHTTVRVNPAGKPFRLGIARIASGAGTLCLIEEPLRARIGETVTLELVKGVYRATGSSPRRTTAGD